MSPAPMFSPSSSATKSVQVAERPVLTGELVVAQDKPLVKIDVAQIDRLLNEDGSSGAMSHVADKMLKAIKASDAGELGTKLNQLTRLARGLDPTARKGVLTKLTRMFGDAKETLMAQYNSVEGQMDRLVAEVDKTIQLHKGRIGDWDTLAEENRQAHIRAEAEIARKKELIVQINAVIEQSKGETDAFAVQNLAALRSRADRLDKQINDRQRLMLLCKNTALQIMQSRINAQSLIDNFTDIENTTIPAWKSVFVQYILQIEQKAGAALANQIADSTDEAFNKQAEAFNTGTQEVAKSAQRALVSDATLQNVQKLTLEAFDRLAQIDEQARQARRASEPQIAALEKELVSKFTARAIAHQQ